MADTPSRTWKIFCSYAEEDEGLFKALRAQLSPAIRQKLLTLNHSHETLLGDEPALIIERYLREADLILLLISPAFMESSECYDRDMLAAMKRHNLEGTIVIPIILRPCDWADTPFAHLRTLPKSNKPVTTLPNIDEAFLEIARSIRERLKALEQQLQTQKTEATIIDITRFHNTSSPHFVTRIPLRYPSEEDFARNLVYLDPNYGAQVRNLLQTKRRALLVGRAAAGKTAFVFALARELMQTENYRIAYKNVGLAVKGEGQYWCDVMRAPGREKVLYILDNCHLMEEEVNAFCWQWESQPPQQAQCILISRAPTQETQRGEDEDEYDNYFTLCASETVTLKAQDVYWEILTRHYQAYSQETTRHYENPAQDNLRELKNLHGPNLMISHTLLEAWQEKGGFLSRVRREAAYKLIRRRYLATDKFDVTNTLPALCVLCYYEIPAHTTFIKTLHRDEVVYLLKRRILVSNGKRGYGTLYNLVFHPEEALLIFEASLSDNGPVSTHVIEQNLTAILKKYLLTMPTNYLQVYARLTRLRQTAILQNLLRDTTIQERAEQQLQRGLVSEEGLGTISKIIEAMQQLGYAETQLQLFINALNVEQLLEYALRKKENPQHLFWLLRGLRRVAPDATIRLLDALTPEGLAALCLARKSTTTTIGQFSKIVPKFFWKFFLEAIPPQELAALYRRSPLGAVGSFIQHHYQHEHVKQGYTLFQQQFLKERFIAAPLSETGKFLHRLRSLSTAGPTVAREALSILLTLNLARKLLDSDMEAFAVLLYEASTISAGDASQLLQPFHNHEAMSKALEQSNIHTIQLLLRNIAHVKPALLPLLLQVLQGISLKEKLAHASLLDSGYLLWNVHEYLDAQLAQYYCQMLDEQLDTQQLQEAPLEDLGRLLLNMYIVGSLSTLHIFAKPVIGDRLAQAWESEPAFSTVLLGLVSLVLPEHHYVLPILSTKAQQRLEQWLRSFAHQQPYLFACTLYGLKAWHEQEAASMLQRVLPYEKVMHFLSEHREKAHNARMIALLENVESWLKRVFAK